ncbi:metallophosphoesterase, partial [Bacillus sp. JJ1503]
WAGRVILVLTISFLIYGTYNAYNPLVRSFSIQIEQGTSSLDSLTIAMAADTHFGLLSGKDHAKRLVKEINGMEPDIILLPGDLIDDDIQPFVDQGIDEVLSELHAPYGVYATLGNHDRHNGTMKELIDTIERSGINVLYDEAVTIKDQLTLIGRKDRRDPDRLELNQIMKGVDLSKPVILLDHQPYDLDIAQKAGIDLMLSGHTHHGQVFPGNLITDSIYENAWGHLKKGSMQSIVTEGFGFWGPPIRIGTRSEIVRIQVNFE